MKEAKGKKEMNWRAQNEIIKQHRIQDGRGGGGKKNEI